ncbi:hypothetical protein [Klebsiella sp. CN_Kp109]|uniref:hypothetical protein n=1 Tax=Klebsiella sp. CN_Kp109 TaxID=3153427 RepID=UPI0032B3927A
MNELFRWSLALVIAVAVYVVIFSSGSHTVSDAQSQYWINDCRLLETNIDRGFLSPAQNRLQCGDVIENVSKADYDSVVNGGEQITTVKALLEELFGR